MASWQYQLESDRTGLTSARTKALVIGDLVPRSTIDRRVEFYPERAVDQEQATLRVGMRIARARR